jgi:hypothetical protein
MSNPGHRSLLHNSNNDHQIDINLLDCYSSLLCCAFIHSGLVRSLTNLCVHDDAETSNSALSLLGDVMVVASRLLPENYCNHLLTMPELT